MLCSYYCITIHIARLAANIGVKNITAQDAFTLHTGLFEYTRRREIIQVTYRPDTENRLGIFHLGKAQYQAWCSYDLRGFHKFIIVPS